MQKSSTGYRTNNYRTNDYRLNNSYVYGNTVRKIAVEELPERKEKVRPERKQLSEEEKKELLRERKEAKRLHKLNCLYILMVTAVVGVLFTMCIQYINLYAESQERANNVASLKAQVNKAITDNDMTEVEINGSINYDEILDIAVNQLGMVYPSRSQVVTYDSSESQYVKQYTDVPSADK